MDEVNVTDEIRVRIRVRTTFCGGDSEHKVKNGGRLGSSAQIYPPLLHPEFRRVAT